MFLSRDNLLYYFKYKSGLECGQTITLSEEKLCVWARACLGVCDINNSSN